MNGALRKRVREFGRFLFGREEPVEDVPGGFCPLNLYVLQAGKRRLSLRSKSEVDCSRGSDRWRLTVGPTRTFVKFRSMFCNPENTLFVPYIYILVSVLHTVIQVACLVSLYSTACTRLHSSTSW